jgi:uncharacterized repeat protein (TIGR03806 family)
MILFAVNAPLWSDGASKQRYLALPDNATIQIGEYGRFILPAGTVLMKTFSLAGSRVETRLLIQKGTDDKPQWAGFSYQWNAAQSDATLLTSGKTVTLANGQQWHFPSSTECQRCHRAEAGFTLGLETAQLNGDLTYPSTGRTANQMATLTHIGLFANPPMGVPSTLPRLAAIDDQTATVASRARAYLHANCSHCHRENATENSCPGDLRVQNTLADMHICNRVPPFGGFGFPGNLLTPGSIDQSLIYQFMNRRGFPQMPPLATFVVDKAAVAVVGAWITSLTSCD